MANRKSNGKYYQYATVDANPGAGFFTDPLIMRSKRVANVIFSVRGTGDMEVKLQFKCPGDADWTDHVSDTVIEPGVRLMISDISDGVQWRAGVVAAGYVSGALTFGFDWKKVYSI